MVISALFDWVRTINQLAEGRRDHHGRGPRGAESHREPLCLRYSGPARRKGAGTASGRDYVTPLVEMLARHPPGRQGRKGLGHLRIASVTALRQPVFVSRTARTARIGNSNNQTETENGRSWIPLPGVSRRVVVCMAAVVAVMLLAGRVECLPGGPSGDVGGQRNARRTAVGHPHAPPDDGRRRGVL